MEGCKGCRHYRQHCFVFTVLHLTAYHHYTADRGGKVVKVLCYKSVGRWLDPSWCQWIFI